MSVSELVRQLSQPLVYTCRPGHSGHGMGNAVEFLAGVEENNVSGPDHPVWGELKNKIDGVNTATTLFTRAPKHNLMDDGRPGRKRGAMRALTDTFGALTEVPGFVDRHNLYITLRGDRPCVFNGVAFTIDRQSERMTILADDNPCAAWDIAALNTAFRRKYPHKMTMTKGAVSDLDQNHPDYENLSATGNAKVATWRAIVQYEEPSLEGFWTAIDNGKVVIEPRGYVHRLPCGRWKSRDHGTAFRIADRDIGLLFAKRTETII